MGDLSIYYLVGVIAGIAITYFFLRWAFSVDKRIEQNKSIINLLTLIAKKQGATDEETHSCINHELKKF